MTAACFQKVSENGFGDPYNSYAHSMVWFNDHLYVGTTRAPLAYRGRQRAEDKAEWLGRIWPVRIPKGIWDIDLRAEIWRFHPPTKTWEKVFASPLVEGMDGDMVPMSVAFRAMTVFQAPSDPHPVIYAPTMATYQTSAVMLRSADGKHFQVVSEEGLGFPDPYKPRGVRALVAFRDLLFVAPAVANKGQRKSYNMPDEMLIMATRDPVRESWRHACEPHFGDPGNVTAFQMYASEDYLYAGTGNIREGFQIWKTDAEGSPPYKWKKIVGHGAYRGKLNQGAITFQSFKGSIYVGTGIQEGGYDRYNNVGPAAIELIRINADDSWDLIVGEPRITPEGLKVPLSGLGPGFGKPSAGYLWSLCEHDGWLYAGTYDWLVGARYGRRDLWPEQVRKYFTLNKVEQFIEKFGGFDIWRSRDGCRWTPVTHNGFGNPFNIGARTMVSTPHGLFVGTANSFAPDVAVQRVSGWEYEHSPRGGLEIWLGADKSGLPAPTPEKAPLRSSGHYGAEKSNERDGQRRLDEAVSRFYGGSGFRHFGHWRVGVKDARSACENLMDEILAFLPEKKGTIVDIGCGLGATTNYLLKHFLPEAVTGITGNRKFLADCVQSEPGVTFLFSRLPMLKVPAESFETAIWVKGLEDLGARENLVRESFRVLKPGGRLASFDVLPSTKRKSSVWGRIAGRRPLEAPEDYYALLTAAGFQEPRVEDVTAESLRAFRKHLAKHLELLESSEQIGEEMADALDARLRMDEAAVCQCLLISALKPENR